MSKLDVDTLRRQAARFRRLAEVISEPTLCDAVLELAARYEAEASRVEAGQ